MTKKFILLVLFLCGLGLVQPAFADTLVPQPSTHWYDGIIGVASDVMTLNNPVQLKNPKKNFSAAQQPTFTLSIPIHTKDKLGKSAENVWKTKSENIEAAIVYQDGTSYPATIHKNEAGQFTLSVDTGDLPHGNFKLEVASKETSFYTRNLTQDFSWGVLAVNTNKSIYSPHEKAQLGFGVLDEDGATICNATITATITDPHGVVTTISTKDNSIKLTSACGSEYYSTHPDYEASYQTTDAGTYQMHIKATNHNGTHAIDDYFLVKDSVPFVVERSAFPTRIYPAIPYPVKFTITANQDFSGNIQEFVPKAIYVDNISDNGQAGGQQELSSIPQNTNPDVLKEDEEAFAKYHGNVSKIVHEMIPIQQKQKDGTYKTVLVHPDRTNTDHTMMPIVWQVDWKKGQTYTLSYTMNFPPVAIDFYTLGPLTIGNTSNPVFKEARQWQIASDANKCWVGGNGATWSGNNWVAATGTTATTLASTDVAIFDSSTTTCTGGVTTNTNSSIDATWGGSAQGLKILTYTGTITQNRSLTLTTVTGIVQSATGSTFTGGSAAITDQSTSSTVAFSLSAGTFTSTSGTLEVDGGFKISGGTFNANGGTVAFWLAGTAANTINGTATFNNLNIGDAGCSSGQGYAISSGKTLTVNGTLTLDVTCQSNNTLNGPGAITANGDIAVNNDGLWGNAVITLSGSGTHSFAGDGGGNGTQVPAITINASGETINFSNTIDITGNWTYSAGTLNFGTSSIQFDDPGSTTNTLTGSTTFNNLTIGTACINTPIFAIASGTTLTVNGTLTFTQGCGTQGSVNGPGSIVATGNVSTSGQGLNGSANITISGSNSQTITLGGTYFPTGTFTVNKSGGTASVAGAYTFDNLTMTAGTFDISGHNFTVTNALTSNGGTIKAQGGETVSLGSSTWSGGTVQYTGSGTYTSLPFGNTMYSLNISGAGSFTPNGAVTLGGSFIQGAGTFVAPSSLTIGGSFTHTGGTFTQGSGTVTFVDNTQVSTISGSNTFYNFTSIVAGKEIDFTASSTTTITNALTLRGNSSSSLLLRSTSSGTQWNIVPQGTITVNYVDLKDSNVCSAPAAPITAASSTNSGNNTCWNFPGNVWYNSNWGYRMRIVINHNKVSGPLTNFPVLVSWTSNGSLASHAQSNGNDILFTDSDGISKLSHEIENYNSSTGELEAWVNVPDLSSTGDKTIYMYYGNASAPNEQNKTAVWDSNFKVVTHLSETSGTTINDSTSFADNGTKNTSTRPNPTTGQISGGQSFNSANPDTVDLGNKANLYCSGPITVEAWVNPSNAGTTRYIMGDYDSGGANSSFALRLDTNNKADFFWENGSVPMAISSTSISAGSWYHLVGVWDGTTRTVYVNGTADGTDTTAESRSDIGGNTMLGAAGSFVGSDFSGSMDETRISCTNRSSDWIKTEYNNMSSPSTFITTFPITNPPSVQIQGGVKFIGGSKLKAN